MNKFGILISKPFVAYLSPRKVNRILYLHGGKVLCFDTWGVVLNIVPKFELQANLQGFIS